MKLIYMNGIYYPANNIASFELDTFFPVNVVDLDKKSEPKSELLIPIFRMTLVTGESVSEDSVYDSALNYFLCLDEKDHHEIDIRDEEKVKAYIEKYHNVFFDFVTYLSFESNVSEVFDFKVDKSLLKDLYC